MGCGDGTWLLQLYAYIEGHTLRGQHLDDYPLQVVGADLSATAAAVAKDRLSMLGVEPIVVAADVADPSSFADVLATHGLDIADGLHIRSFLDHDRDLRFRGSTEVGLVEPGMRVDISYLSGEGQLVPAAVVKADLVRHLRAWARLVHRHGMLVIEAHAVPDALIGRHLGELHSLAFDAYHALSGQYPVDYETWLHCCVEAGLQIDGRLHRHYPSNEDYVAVSTHLFLGQGG